MGDHMPEHDRAINGGALSRPLNPREEDPYDRIPIDAPRKCPESDNGNAGGALRIRREDDDRDAKRIAIATFAASANGHADVDRLKGPNELLPRRARDVVRQVAKIAELDGDRARRRVRGVDAAACEQYEADDASDESRHLAILVRPHLRVDYVKSNGPGYATAGAAAAKRRAVSSVPRSAG